MNESLNIEKVNIMNQLSDYFETDNIVGLGSFLKSHPEITTENYKEEILAKVESFFIKHLQYPDEEEDLNKLHEFVNLNFYSQDELESDPKIVQALLKALEDLRKEKNNTAIGRIKNLKIFKEDRLEIAA
jgi:hypothetical protein